MPWWLPYLIGAGAGLIGNAGSSRAPQQQSTGLDPESQEYVRGMRERATAYADRQMPGLDPAFLEALGGFQGYAGAGQDALRALTDPTAAQSFFNPYLSAMNPVFDRMRQQSLRDVRSNLTRPGGGALRNVRMGLAEGSAMRGANEAQAQFNYQGFNDAMQRAMGVAGLGFGALDPLARMGDYMTNRQRNWDIQSLGLLSGGLGPTGQQTQRPNDQGSWLQAMLGGALGFGGMFGGGGGGGGGAAPGTPVPGTYGQV